MKKNPNQPADDLRGRSAAELRRRAEEQLQSRKPAGGGQAAQLETVRLVHELQVHQIELEMQNEELQQTRAKAEALLARVKLLSGLVPICAHCKKIQDDQGYFAVTQLNPRAG